MTPDWADLELRYPPSWVAYLKRRHDASQPIDATVDLFATRRGLEGDERLRWRNPAAAAGGLLEELAESAWLTRTPRWRCPVCAEPLNAADLVAENCPFPDDEGNRHAYADGADPLPRPDHLYRREGVERRVVEWLLALHGMNTLGAWQETFNWLVSISYGYMVPVHIYKYGRVTAKVLRRRKHDELAMQLRDRILRARRDTEGIVHDPRPDVIAHSFGTLLLGKALHADEHLQVRRVITLGCILRPDFDWATLVERGQVEAVLNNHGTADAWVRRSHATIPDAGPSGYRGFDMHVDKWPAQHRDPVPVFNVPAEGFSHSEFFDDDGPPPTKLRDQFTKVWRPFLRTASIADIQPELAKAGSGVHRPLEAWVSHGWPRRALTGGWGKARHTYAERRVGAGGGSLTT